MIGTIAGFESRSLLRSAQTWLIAGVLAIVFAYLFLQALETYLEIQPNLAAQDHPTGLSGFLSIRYLAPLVMVFALMAPLLAMKSFSDEYRQQTLALWQSSPVSTTALVLGKFTGVAMVIVFLIVIACSIALFMRLFTSLDLGVLSASALGLTLASLSFAAIGMFFSSLTRHAIVAVAASVLLLVLLWLLGNAAPDSVLMNALSLFAIPTHLASFFQGYIGSGDVAYFVVITVLFIAMTIMRMDSLRHLGSHAMTRSAIHQSLLFVLVIGIALCSIWLASRTNMSVDLTANKRHALSEQTVNAVKALQGPVSIVAVVGPAAAQRSTLTELVSRYQKHNPLISLDFVNPDTDPERVRQLNAAASGELIVTGMGREQRLQSVSERSLTGALRQLNREGDRKLAFVVGHEERSAVDAGASNWTQLSARLNSIGLNSETLSLVTHPRIGDDVDVLVIADPRRPYFPGEIAALLEYVNHGGSLLWLTETVLNKQSGSGLAALGLELGIDIMPGIIIDTASQAANAGSPAFVILNSFSNHPVTQGLTSPILLPQAKALSVTSLAGQTLLPLLQTPEASWTETGALEGAVQFNQDADEQQGPLVVGVTIERDIKGKQQRIAVIGDADFASDRFIGNGANLGFAESLMLWLSGESDALSFVTMPAPDAHLTLSSRSIVILSVTLLFILPFILFMMAGIAAWRRRH